MTGESFLKSVLEGGGFAITAEICPPRGADTEEFVRKARVLKGKIVAANATDTQGAVMGLSGLACSVILLREGIEPVFQMTCRDRNRLAVQSDSLGAWALGIKNILALTGDHVSFGDHREAKAVYDLDSVQLVDAIDGVNKGGDTGANGDRGGTGFFIGAVVAPQA